MHGEETGDTFSRQMSLVEVIATQRKMKVGLRCQETRRVRR